MRQNPETCETWDLSSAGRASALQAEGHRFEPYRSHICRCGGTGRRTGLKILRDLYSHTGSIPVAGISHMDNMAFQKI